MIGGHRAAHTPTALTATILRALLDHTTALTAATAAHPSNTLSTTVATTSSIDSVPTSAGLGHGL
ncbi:hypothetical protein ACQP2U_43535 (plasmid) [Nocardia sp. CA-084685]|uniref:hypothetical protein n=1 Tax=Nocardia sp. CA-084685 TaxID=3239970 RepID=UPI003D97A256